jgi:hypothetical protein
VAFLHYGPHGVHGVDCCPSPSRGAPRPIRVGVWAEISVEVYRRVHALWSDPNQSDEPRPPGMPASHFPLNEEESVGALVCIQLTGPKTRPEFYVQSVEHPLHAEQTYGIDEHRALEYSDRSRRTSS